MDNEPDNKTEETEQPERERTVYELVIDRIQKDPNLSYGERTMLHAVAVIGVDLARNIHVLAEYVATLNNGLSNAQARTPDAAGQMAFTFPGSIGDESTVRSTVPEDPS